MKKTLTVNLGGTVYHIDEDAYILLDNYLNNLRYHFRKDEGAEEIVRDIESRIAELFDEALRGGLQVITIKEVEEVIARMGKPEELNGEEDGNPSASNSKTFDSESTETRRRLFRNPDDRILGGVVSGIAAYFGWDVTWTHRLYFGRIFYSWFDSGLSVGMDYHPAGTYGYGKVADARRTHQCGKHRPDSDRRF